MSATGHAQTYWEFELDRAVGRYWAARNLRLRAVEQTVGVGQCFAAPERAQPPDPILAEGVGRPLGTRVDGQPMFDASSVPSDRDSAGQTLDRRAV